MIRSMVDNGVMTLDVEDWDHANFSQLSSHEGRWSRSYAMDANTDRWIELLGQTGSKSTCFVLGEFARRYPKAIGRLSAAGHEIASHGDHHSLIYQMTQEQFREFLKRGLGSVAELTGKAPIGFRAPSWSVDGRTPWFCEELEKQGIRYDSSEFPIQTPLYGLKDASLQVHWSGHLLRIPVTVLSCGGVRIPFASGAFFRLSPLSLIRFGLKRALRQKLPAMVVLHPRELDAAHPRLPLKGWEGWVHYACLPTVIPKLQAILKDFRWGTIADSYKALLDTPGSSLEN